jgi:hypothetical protein
VREIRSFEIVLLRERTRRGRAALELGPTRPARRSCHTVDGSPLRLSPRRTLAAAPGGAAPGAPFFSYAGATVNA